MNVSVLLAHPNPKSFNAAIAQKTVQTLKARHHRVFFHDLYRERFNPVLSRQEIPKQARIPKALRQYCREITASQGLILIHPNWWGQPPAILKGWVDRVLRPGTAYEFLENDSGEGIPIGLLKLRQVLILNTSNTPREREEKIFQDPLRLLWKNCILGLCGVRNIHRKIFRVVVTSSAAKREQWLKETESTVRRLF